jgi:5'(3')-deoxyribonucleotidase
LTATAEAALDAATGLGRVQLRLGIDLDGVVADFNTGWMERYNRQFGTALHHSQVLRWDGLHRLTHFATMDDFWAWAQLGDGSVFRDLPPIPGAIETIAELAADHRIVIISSKFDWAIPDTLAWMSEHRVLAREIHFVWDKTSVPCDVYLEDAPHNLEALVSAHPAALVCRMVRAWNDPVAGAVDVSDWTEFRRYVEERARQRAVAPATPLPRS